MARVTGVGVLGKDPVSVGLHVDSYCGCFENCSGDPHPVLLIAKSPLFCASFLPVCMVCLHLWCGSEE